MITFRSHVFRVCILIGSLFFLQEAATQRPYFEGPGAMYPMDGYYGPLDFSGFNSFRNFQPYPVGNYFSRRPFPGPHSNMFGPRFPQTAYLRTTPLFRRSGNGIFRPPLIGRLRPKTRREKIRKVRYHEEKKQKAAIRAGMFPTIFPHPKIQRHIHHKAKKRARFKAIARAKSFNGILKGTALDVSF